MRSINEHVRRFARWARSAPPPPQSFKGEIADVLAAERVVTFILDSNGRVFHAVGGSLKGVSLHPISNGRSAVLDVLDKFDIQDRPTTMMETPR